MAHNHEHRAARYNRAFGIGIGLNIGFVIFEAVFGILSDSLALLAGIDFEEVATYLSEIPGVEAVHDLHIWAMSTTETALTAHVVKPDVENEDALLARIRAECCDRFGIGHVTLQVERGHALADCDDGACNVCKVQK